MPPRRSRPKLIGTSRTVVSFIRPVAESTTRWVTSRGKSATTLNTTRMPITISRERILRIVRSLRFEAVLRRPRVARELFHKRVARGKRLHVPQPAHPFDRYRFAVQVLVEVEQMDLQGS